MKVERATMTRSPVLLSDIGALELSHIIQTYQIQMEAELFHADPQTHAFNLLDDKVKTAKKLREILDEAFPFLGELPE